MKKCESLQVSENIYKKLRKLIKSDECWVECFDNCREQGYIIKSIGMNIAFSQHRCSDSIVVYDFVNSGHPSNLPKEEDPGWDQPSYFRYNEVDDAAYYIAELVKAKLAEERNINENKS